MSEYRSDCERSMVQEHGLLRGRIGRINHLVKIMGLYV
jgi:hypothetical protein